MIDGLLVYYIQGAYEPSGWIVHQGDPGSRRARVLKAITHEGRNGMPIAEIVADSSRTIDLEALESAGPRWLHSLEQQMGEAPAGQVPEIQSQTTSLGEQGKRELLQDLDAAQPRGHGAKGSSYESVAVHMFEALGARVVLQEDRPKGTPGIGVVDLSVWSPELEQINSNPLLVAVKPAKSGASLTALAGQLCAYTPTFGTWTLLLNETRSVDRQLYASLQAKHVLITSLRDAIEGVAHDSLVDYLRQLVSRQSEQAGL
jgi:hypothetical protein